MDEGNRWIMWLMFFAVVGLAFFLPLVDNDFGWHYVCGNRILSGARWCLENDLTYLLPGYKWAYTAFIYDALIAWGYNLGGFLIWQLPEMKMFVDGRMPAWIGEGSKSPYTTWLEVIQAQPGWNEYLLGMGTEYLLIAPGTFLDLELDEGGALELGWEEEYRDKGAVVYGRM
ncbi:hypothetical protein KJ953_01615 [Patescibacteria group bacterium]|nr:hypothetical protein [Patescibacteria group bacterium]MBU1256669.1 hypothetical protein [Patescibacteria group bacterium]MBU1457897.1 hypothetical protein [Patescibacteria group bacterium]